MPVVRVTRDRRGYEHIYLIHADARRDASSPGAVLYWYRTPPAARVGRRPFDEEVRRALEAEYPHLVFEWDKIAQTASAQAETERWRERRRVERATRPSRVPPAPDAQEQSDRREEASPVEDDPEGGGEGAPQQVVEALPGTDSHQVGSHPDGVWRRRRRRNRP